MSAREGTPRRTVIYGVAAAGAAFPLLAACGSDSGDAVDSTDSTDVTGSSEPDAAASPTESGSGDGGVTVKASDVPEGGGTVLTAEKLVVTQPKAGEYKAFSAVCTHQQCLVTQVEDGEILCPCHFSKFSIEDGSVLDGPAGKPLTEHTVTANGDELSIG